MQIEEDDDESYNFNAFRQWMRLCFRLKPADILELVKFVDEMAKIGRENQKSFFSYALKVLRNATIINQGDAKLLRSDLAQRGQVAVKNRCQHQYSQHGNGSGHRQGIMLVHCFLPDQTVQGVTKAG